MADTSASGSLTASWDGVTPATAPAGSVVLLAPSRDATVGVDVRGTFTATITLETSVDGLNWAAPSVTTLAGAGSTATFTAPGSRLVAVSGAALLRARCSAYTSGTATVVMAGTPGGGGGAAGGGGGGAVTGTVTTQDVAVTHGVNPAATDAGSPVTPLANRAGVPFVIGGHPNPFSVTANLTAAQTDLALVTVAAGLKIILTGFLVTASNANTVNTSVILGFGTANIPPLTANTPVAGVVGSHPGIGPGSGFGRGGGSGILGVGADNEDLRITSGAPTGGSLTVTVSGFTIES